MQVLPFIITVVSEYLSNVPGEPHGIKYAREEQGNWDTQSQSKEFHSRTDQALSLNATFKEITMYISSLKKCLLEPGMVVEAYKPKTQKAKAGGSRPEGQGQFELDNKYQANHDYAVRELDMQFNWQRAFQACTKPCIWPSTI